MTSNSPTEALGSHAAGVRGKVVEVIRAVHDRFAEAHAVSGSRYGMGFGSQWRDLLDAVHDDMTKYGFQPHTLNPGGYKVPVVNDCLVYVWRVPDAPDAVGRFATSPTRHAGFVAAPPPPMLFEPAFDDEAEPADETGMAETNAMLAAVRETMPLVLVMVHSTPRQLHAIEWAVAELNDAGRVELYGQESVWASEVAMADVASKVESFDSGNPVPPVVELRAQEDTDPNAR